MLLLLKIIVALLAAAIIFIEQLRVGKEYRKTGLWIAFALMIASLPMIWVEHLTTSKFEIERKADLFYLQKLDSPVQRLGFDFFPAQIDTGHIPFEQFSMRMDVGLMEWGRNIGFYSVMNLNFSTDSGWTIAADEFYHSPYGETSIKFDSSSKHLYVWLKDFGICWHGQQVWRPQRLADLGVIRMQMGIGLQWNEYDPTSKILIHYRPAMWCPIKQIDVYANSLDDKNRIFTALPYERKGAHYWIDFFPRSDSPFTDTTESDFIIDPLWMHANILKSLQK